MKRNYRLFLCILLSMPVLLLSGCDLPSRLNFGKTSGKALSNLLSVKVIMSLIETCKAKYKFRLTLKVPHCFCYQQDTACRPHDADRKAA